MFPKEIQTIFNAQTAGQQNDPRFEKLLDALVERTGLNKDEVINNIVRLANGDISV